MAKKWYYRRSSCHLKKAKFVNLSDTNNIKTINSNIKPRPQRSRQLPIYLNDFIK